MIIDLHTHNSVGSPDSSISPEELITKAKERRVNAICITDHDSYKAVEELKKIGKKNGILVIRGIELTTKYGHLLIYGTDFYKMFKINKDELLNVISRKKNINIEDLKEVFHNFYSPIISNINNSLFKIHENGGAIVLAHPFGKYGKNTFTIRYFQEEYLRIHKSKDVKIDELLGFIKEKEPPYYSILQQVDGIEVLNPLCLSVENRAAIVLANFLDKKQIGSSDCHIIEDVGICVTEFPNKIKNEKDFIYHLRQKDKTIPIFNYNNYCKDRIGFLEPI